MNKQRPNCHYYDDNKCDEVYMYVWTNRMMYSASSFADLTSDVEKGVLGGEASAWGESIDEQNFFEVVFQRFGAIAERFWSPSNITERESHEVRANYVRCLGLRKGILIGTGPLYHGICQLEQDIV